MNDARTRPYRSGLDGLRGLAVVAVVLFHDGVGWARGGYLGVDVFFVLSGFLVTGLLLDVAPMSRRELMYFWSRRGRRLVPALLAVVLGVVVFDQTSWHLSTGDVVSTVSFTSNWRFVASSVSYATRSGAPSPLLHTWSLAVEAQLYICWALLVSFVARGTSVARVAKTLGLALSLAAVSLVLAASLAGSARPERVFFGSDTRAASFLVGAALVALLDRYGPMNRALPSWTESVWNATAGGGLVVLAIAASTLAVNDPMVFRGGTLAVAIATAAVIAGTALAPTGVVSRALSVSPLAALGRISYGVYLWHWPIQLWLTKSRTGIGGTALLGLRGVVTIGIAALSSRMLEIPLRRTTGRGSIRWSVLAMAGVALATATLSVVALDERAPSVISHRAQTSGPTTRPSATAVAIAVATTMATPPTSRSPAIAELPRTRVAFFGDSVSQSLARGVATISGPYGIVAINDAILGCGVASSGGYRLSGTEYALADECAGWVDAWGTRVRRDRPDVVAVLVGRHEVLDRQLDGAWTNILDSPYAAYLRVELDRAIAIVGQTGARVVLLTAPYFQRPESPAGEPWPENNPARVDAYNALLRDVAAAHGVSTVDLGDRLDPERHYASSVDGIRVRNDGVHVSPAGARWLAPWLLPLLRP